VRQLAGKWLAQLETLAAGARILLPDAPNNRRCESHRISLEALEAESESELVQADEDTITEP